MFENIMKFFKKLTKKEESTSKSKETAKERLHLVLVQDRAHVSADFLDLMKQEIIEVIKKYIEVDESLIDVHLTNHSNEDGTNGAPALYANIPIKNIKDSAKKSDKSINDKDDKNNEAIESKSDNSETNKEDNKDKKEDKENIKENEEDNQNVQEEVLQEEIKEENNKEDLKKEEKNTTQEKEEIKSDD